MIKEFFNSHEKKEYDNIHRLKANLKILEKNFLELRKRNEEVLQKTENPKYWSSSNPYQRVNDHFESTRLILNYLANAKTLIDSSRSYNKLIKNSIYEAQFQELKGAFVSDSMVKFLLDLRNFLSHQGFIDIGIKRIVNKERKMSYLFLDKDQLNNYKKGWTKEAKIFISNSEKEILIFEFIEDFHFRLKLINDWLYLKLFLLKKEEMQSLQSNAKKLINLHDTDRQRIHSLSRYLKKILKQLGQ